MRKINLIILSLVLILTLTTTILVTANTKETDIKPTIKGIGICGTKFICGVSDSVCPETYAPGYYCYIEDPDCEVEE